MLLAAPPTVADARAHENRVANARALDVSIRPPLDLEWVFGRDGSLTARRADGTWLAGCSVPTAAGRAAFKNLAVKGTCACLLAPPHAGHLAAVLEKLSPAQAVLVIVPDEDDFATLLACADFSQDIERRLFFVVGGAWPRALADVFARHPGLPLPTQFLRVPGAAAGVIDPLIAAAQPVFAAAAASAKQTLRDLAAASASDPAGPACVVAAPAFRLWNDAGRALRSVFADAKFLDPDEPIHASSLALARAAVGCSRVVMADAGRADFTDVIAPALPWTTWVTRGRVPAHTDACAADTLLLADPAWLPRARAAGWPVARVRVATWPSVERPTAPGGLPLALVFDLPSLDAPAVCEEFSSWRVLWDSIKRELVATPQALGNSPDDYLSCWLARASQVEDARFPRALFVDALIAPAFALGIARQLLTRGVPLTLDGAGWADDEVCRPAARPAVRSAEDLAAVVAGASGLVDVFIGRTTHPIQAHGRPVLRCVGRSADDAVRDARVIVAGQARGMKRSDALCVG